MKANEGSLKSADIGYNGIKNGGQTEKFKRKGTERRGGASCVNPERGK